MIRRLGFLFLIWLPAIVSAQTDAGQPDFKAVTQTLDLSLATKGSLTTAALSLNRLYGLGKLHRFKIGYGLRLTSAFGQATDYRTAPADLVKGNGKASVVGLFSKDLEEHIDTLRLSNTLAHSVNISLNLEYALSHRLDLGVNIDLIGFTVGPKQSGTFIANSPSRSPLSGTIQEASLTAFNILLGDKSDRGSLNSEGYVRYRLTNRFSLRGGLSFQFNEYTTSRKLTFDNDRFRSSNARILGAIAYHW
ncbi:hypothetical protein [Spirosoma pollinicola]|uniref:Outer membrane protein beta-barrel domain-containing protein n=1 Tax=Spirosoma pollinicola TaxID=2057025 RepID=A0A2K8Z0S6_9BACT|nr:hypothetical protein [Spirosoma pollinicola]AUD03490.1 hypothetical protein CWM47_17630 [Spirosoma pollinicola]